MKKQKRNSFILLQATFVMALLIEGCGGTPTPTQMSTPTTAPTIIISMPPSLIATEINPIQTSISEERQLSQEDIGQVASKRTVGQILIDETLSGGCGKDLNDLMQINRDVRFDIPRFLISLGILAGGEDKLHLGVAAFDTYQKDLYHEIVPFQSITDYQNTTEWYDEISLRDAEQRLRPHQRSNDPYFAEDYVELFKKARDILSSHTEERNFLTIITDGSIKPQLTVDLKQNIKKSLLDGQNVPEIYIILLCPSRLSTEQQKFWTDRFDSSSLAYDTHVKVYEVENPQDPPEALVKDLTKMIVGEYLPLDNDKLWIDSDNSRIPIGFPAGANSMSIRLVSFQAKRIELQDALGNNLGMEQGLVPNIMTKTLNNPSTGNGCGQVDFYLKGYDAPTSFYWLRTDLPDFFVEFTRPSNAINQKVVEVKVNISSSINKDILQNCYTVQMNEKEQASLLERSSPCDAANPARLCLTPDGKLEAAWQWQPPNLATPKDILLSLSILSGDNSFGAVDLSMPIYFQAEPRPQLDSTYFTEHQGKIDKDLRHLLDVYVYTINFQYDVQTPGVEIHTENTDLPATGSELAKLGQDPNGNNYACPVDNDGDNAWITLDGKDWPISGTSPIQFTPTNDKGAQTQYVIAAYRYVMEKCGYTQVNFRWNGGDHILPITAIYYLP